MITNFKTFFRGQISGVFDRPLHQLDHIYQDNITTRFCFKRNFKNINRSKSSTRSLTLYSTLPLVPFKIINPFHPFINELFLGASKM